MCFSHTDNLLHVIVFSCVHASANSITPILPYNWKKYPVCKDHIHSVVGYLSWFNSQALVTGTAISIDLEDSNSTHYGDTFELCKEHPGRR